MDKGVGGLCIQEAQKVWIVKGDSGKQLRGSRMKKGEGLRSFRTAWTFLKTFLLD